MSEPDVAAVIKAGRSRAAAPVELTQAVPVEAPASRPIQPVTLQGKALVEPSPDDPQIGNLMRRGMTEAEALKLVSDIRRMW
jgi:hypothetical protein